MTEIKTERQIGFCLTGGRVRLLYTLGDGWSLAPYPETTSINACTMKSALVDADIDDAIALLQRAKVELAKGCADGR